MSNGDQTGPATSSASPYREPGSVDRTDVEIARMKEAEETKRKVESLRLDAKAKAREDWMAWYNRNDAPAGLMGFAIVAVVTTCCALVIMFAVHAWWGHG